MLNRGDVDGGVVQMISAGCSLDKGVLLLVCAAGRDYVDVDDDDDELMLNVLRCHLTY